MTWKINHSETSPKENVCYPNWTASWLWKVAVLIHLKGRRSFIWKSVNQRLKAQNICSEVHFLNNGTKHLTWLFTMLWSCCCGFDRHALLGKHLVESLPNFSCFWRLETSQWFFQEHVPHFWFSSHVENDVRTSRNKK